MKAPALIYLEWLDAGTLGDGHVWMSADDVKAECAEKYFINRSVGWLVFEDKDVLVVASQIQTCDSEPRYDLVMRIPKAMIKSRKVVKE